jgi:signal transduction histidine kinase
MAVSTPSVAAGAPPATATQPTAPSRGATDRVFPAWVRRLGVAYVAVTVPAFGWLARDVSGQADFATALAWVATAYTVPGLVAAVVAERRVTGEHLVWRLWAGGFGLVLVSAWLLQQEVVHGWDALQRVVPPIIGVAIVLIAAANVLVVRSRSGQRAIVVDAVETVMAALAVVVPVGLVVARPILASDHAWFALTMALIATGACHGIVVAATITARIERGHRTLGLLGIAVMASIVVDSSASAVQALHDFTLPVAPNAVVHALCIGLAGLFFLWSERRPAPGLDRFPPQAQVRRRSTITLLVLAVIPVIGVEAWLLRHHDGVVVAAVAAALVLLVLSSVRHLLSARETIRLYSAVERAADERGRLLADVMAHVDADRHRVAAHLHRQAVALYTAMASFTASLDRASGPGAPHPGTAVAIAAERMRADLARQVDELRQVAIAVEPLPRAGGGASRLAPLVRAYVEGLYGDGPRPQLTVDIDPDLVLDWTTEAIVLRIVQEATHNVWRHAGAGRVLVRVAAARDGLAVEVADDGAGIGDAAPGRGIESMRTVAGFIDGDLHVGPRPGGGTLVRAVVGPAVAPAPPAPRRPHLRLVQDD